MSGDGSDMNGGTGVITTEMVTGEGDAGYALQISNTNAMNWGGLLMFYFPFARHGAGVLGRARLPRAWSSRSKASSPSGRFGVSIGMLDTDPDRRQRALRQPDSSDCKHATVELTLPADAATWTQVQVPWSAFTPGVGSAAACVPVTGQNIMRLVIQPFMSYPPPDYMFEPGPYTIAVRQREVLLMRRLAAHCTVVARCLLIGLFIVRRGGAGRRRYGGATL